MQQAGRSKALLNELSTTSAASERSVVLRFHNDDLAIDVGDHVNFEIEIGATRGSELDFGRVRVVLGCRAESVCGK